MRSGLFLLLLALPGVALAAEDRYGPARAPDPALNVGQPATAAPRQASAYEGQMLSWSSKPAAPSTQSAPRSQATAVPPLAAAAQSRLPTGLYDGPGPQAAAVRPAPAPSPKGPVPQPPPTPQPIAQAPPTWQAPGPAAVLPPPPTPAPMASPAMTSASGAYNAPRAYSVVREYGGTPDRIPPPPPQSAFTGREVALDPGLLSEPRDDDPREEDEEETEKPRKPVTKDRK